MVVDVAGVSVRFGNCTTIVEDEAKDCVACDLESSRAIFSFISFQLCVEQDPPGDCSSCRKVFVTIGVSYFCAQLSEGDGN